MEKKSHSSDWASVILAVKSPLGFFALVILVSEVILAIMANKATGSDFTLLLVSMVGIVAALVGIVAFRAKSLMPVSADSEPALPAFCTGLTGYWWERITPNDASAMSVMEIRPDPASRSVTMRGRAYRTDGSYVAVWESQAVCINEPGKKIFYYWRGWHPERPEEPYEGFGEMAFSESAGTLNRGTGFFSDSNLTQLHQTTRKSAELLRCSPEEIPVIQAGRESDIARLVEARLQSMGG